MRAVRFSKPEIAPAVMVQVSVCASSGEPSYRHHFHMIASDAAGRPVAHALMREKHLAQFRGWGFNIIAARAIGGMSVTYELSDLVTCGASHMGTVRRAQGLRLSADSNGKFHIEFLDRAEAPFACAVLDADEFARLLGDGCDVLEIASKGGLAIEPHAGAA